MVLGGFSLVDFLLISRERGGLLPVRFRDRGLMGSSSSKRTSFRSASSSSRSNHGGYSQSDYGQEYENYPPQQPSYPSYAPPQQPYPSYAPPQQYQSDEPPQQNYSSSQGYGDNRRRLERMYSRIADDYRSLDEVIFTRVASLNFRSKYPVVVLWLCPLESILYMLWVSNTSFADRLDSDFVGK